MIRSTFFWTQIFFKEIVTVILIIYSIALLACSGGPARVPYSHQPQTTPHRQPSTGEKFTRSERFIDA